jgi:hypothetical protein
MRCNHPLRRWGAIALTVALSMIAPAAAAAIVPESDVLLPWFEVDLEKHDSGLTTIFSVVNASNDNANAQLTIYTNWGIPVLDVLLAFDRGEVKSIALEDWIARGLLPGRTLDAAALADLQARLTGRPSPVTGLYSSTPVAPGVAVGYVVVRTLGEGSSRPDVLWGDTYVVDRGASYFSAETLTALTHGLQADCSRHAVRFVNQGELFHGDELIIWSGRRFEPSPTPVPIGPKMNITLSVYDQSGRHVQDCHRALIAVESVMVCHLDITPTIGWLEITSDDPTYILQHLHSVSSASAELHSYCLPQSLKVRGPAITLEKKIDGEDADHPPGPRITAGDAIEFTYEVTNSGTETLTSIVVIDDGEVTCPKATLAPGESMTCTSAAVAQPCLNLNVATATGTTGDGTRVSFTDVAYYTGVVEPSLRLELLVNDDEADTPPGPPFEAGDVLHWTFLVTNDGDVAVTDIAVERRKGEAATCPKTTLDPGESMTCIAGSLAAEGQQHEVGTARGNDPCSRPVVATDPAYYFGRRDVPSISLEKYIGESEGDTPPWPVIPAGAPIAWRFLVTNSGNVPLAAVAVSDSLGIAVTCPKTTLEPGESMTCTASSTAQPCEQSNTATVTATAGEQTVSATDPATYTGYESPAATLELRLNGDDADTPPGPWADEGSTLQLTYLVTNSGDVRLSGIVVHDDAERPAACPKSTLEPGESMTCTATLVAAAGTHDILGMVSARSACNVPVEASDPAYYRGRTLTASIDVVKMTNGVHSEAPPGPVVAIGTTVAWSYIVTNNGTVALTGVSVVDDRGVAVTCPKTALEPGESMTCTASGVAVACQYANVATASGHAPSEESVTASDASYYYGRHNAAIALDKKTNGEDATVPPGPSLLVGSTVQWTYAVTNTGDVALTSVTVTDDHVAVTCPKTTLEPGESMTCTASEAAIAGQQRNAATASGTPPCGDAVAATDVSHYLGVAPGIGIEKLINGEDADASGTAVEVAAGAPILWSFVVTNTGDVDLASVAVTDDPALTILCPKTTLVPGESMTCIAAGTASTGLHCDTATASGISPQSASVSASDSACYFGVTLGNQGCTPGYWKNHTASWPPTGYSPSQSVVSVFSQASLYPPQGSATLLTALGFGGGSGVSGAAEILLRAGVAALLNAAHPSVAYPQTPSTVLTTVNAALASGSRDTMLALAAQLDADNNRGCPLN